MIKQKKEIMENWNNIHETDRGKELDYLVDEVQKIMLSRIKMYVPLNSEQLNVLAMEIK